MELIEGILSRRSIRAFKPEEVPEKLIVKLLEIATHAPSAVNLQPWEFFVIKGQVLRDLKAAYVRDYRDGKLPNPDVPVGQTRDIAPVLEGVYKERQVALAKQIFGVLDINKANKKEKWSERMVQFYYAPTIIVIAVDRVLQSDWPILDVGLVAENVALCALEFGLGTCIMRAIVDYPENLRKIALVPESKRIIIGLAIGYPDWDHPIAHISTGREKVQNLVRFVE